MNPKKQEDKGRNVAVYVQLSTFFIRPAESFPNYGHVFKRLRAIILANYARSFYRLFCLVCPVIGKSMPALCFRRLP